YRSGSLLVPGCERRRTGLLRYTSHTAVDCRRYLDGLAALRRPPRSLQRQTLAEVIEPRYTELLNLVNDEILQLQEQLRQQGVKHHLAAGIVLTGGAAQIDGLAACAQRVFHTQVRIGQPLNITGLTDYAQEPYYSTAVGLLHYGKESHLSGETEVEKRASVGNWFKRINSWLRKEF
ncbi:cell division FtsA domain-containing protein, partial [Streptomyces sp. NPDC051815]|uniref:cell division FtsA domain-containing protein n=1 Tax=Streptomyces sp. NPDC051815 TaxID=3365674 RepID=UPI0037DD431F